MLGSVRVLRIVFKEGYQIMAGLVVPPIPSPSSARASPPSSKENSSSDATDDNFLSILGENESETEIPTDTIATSSKQSSHRYRNNGKDGKSEDDTEPLLYGLPIIDVNIQDNPILPIGKSISGPGMRRLLSQPHGISSDTIGTEDSGHVNLGIPQTVNADILAVSIEKEDTSVTDSEKAVESVPSDAIYSLKRLLPGDKSSDALNPNSNVDADTSESTSAVSHKKIKQDQNEKSPESLSKDSTAQVLASATALSAQVSSSNDARLLPTNHSIPVSVTALTQQLVAQSSSLKNGETAEMQLRLRPPDLGDVSVTLHRSEGGRLSALLIPVLQDAAQVIKANLHHLQTALDQQSFGGRANVAVDNGAYSGHQSHQPWQQPEATSSISSMPIATSTSGSGARLRLATSLVDYDA
jgi:hypothetical protein